MGSGIYVALSGAVAQGHGLDMVANNVANASTPGYQAERLRFGEVLASASSKETSFAISMGSETDTSPGRLVDTQNPLDVAISGDAYFGVTTPSGVRYTRAGDFRIDADGTLVTKAGFAVNGEGGQSIVIPPNAQTIEIEADGVIWADQQVVGALELTRFKPGTLVREGATLYRGNGTVLSVEDPVEILQGSLEMANTNVVKGMIELINVQRTYEALHRMLEVYKQIDQRTAREIGNS